MKENYEIFMRETAATVFDLGEEAHHEITHLDKKLK